MPNHSLLVRSALIALVLTSSASASAQQTAPRSDRTVWPDEGPRTWTPRPTEAAITANDLRTRLYQIADDSMQGRDIGSRGDYKATAYIADVFHRLGLRPAGEKGTYFQDLPYGAFALQGSAPRLTIGRTTFTAGARWLPLAPSGASGTGSKAELRNVSAVFAGHFGDTVTLDPARFRGKVAVFTGGPRVPESQGGAGHIPSCDSLPDRFGADAAIADDARNRARGVRTFAREDERARKAGAVGVLFIEPIDTYAAAAALHPRAGMPVSDSIVAGPASAVIDSATAQQLFGRQPLSSR